MSMHRPDHNDIDELSSHRQEEVKGENAEMKAGEEAAFLSDQPELARLESSRVDTVVQLFKSIDLKLDQLNDDVKKHPGRTETELTSGTAAHQVKDDITELKHQVRDLVVVQTEMLMVQKDLAVSQEELLLVQKDQLAAEMESSKHRAIEFALEYIRKERRFMIQYHDEEGGENFLSYLVPDILFQFRKGCGYFIPKGRLEEPVHDEDELDDEESSYPYEAFKDKVIDILHEILGRKPVVRLCSNGEEAIFFS